MAWRDPIVNPLQASVHRRLDDLSRTFTSADSGADFTQHNGRLLVEALRTLLADHEVDATGHCALCHGRRSRLFGRRKGHLPCRAYLSAQLTLDAAPDTATDATVVLPVTRPHHHRRARADLHFAS